MKRYFWMIAIVTFLGLFTSQSANAEGHRYNRGNRHSAKKAYNAGYHKGARDARRYDNRYERRSYYHGGRHYYSHRNYRPRHYRRPAHYYAPRPVVRVAVPLPPRPRVVIHN